MIRKLAPLALLCLPLAPLLAQGAPPPAPAASAPAVPVPAPKPATTRVTLQTADGPIVVEVEIERAPITAANFLRYVDQKRLDGTNFYRAVKVGPGIGLVQAGTRNNPKKTLKPIPHEATTKTGLSHVDGALSMARGAPGTAGGDFFITVGAFPSMDADPTQPGDNAGYAVFGRVVEGMDVVRKILEAPVSPTEGEGDLKGQMLSPVIAITTARRTPAP
ncbi:peptidylprolyl isomerase [Sphingomonas profundi]|uniref:peptidylprolyl isomerase n=1 Tax=Alterirhizorhabdus profundi TaxID=2681549 RepID=UPI0012E6F7D2|nr:peptidylprolyl isomerase [Sphingomonas profundi]